MTFHQDTKRRGQQQTINGCLFLTDVCDFLIKSAFATFDSKQCLDAAKMGTDIPLLAHIAHEICEVASEIKEHIDSIDSKVDLLQ